MIIENGNRDSRKKHLFEAINKPHLLVYEEKPLSKNIGKTADRLITSSYCSLKLQIALARNCTEDELKYFIDFFTKALERQRKMKTGKKAEIINLNNKSD